MQELEDRVEEDSKPEVREAAVASPTSSALRRGSLFYELSMQLKEEIRHSQAAKQETLEKHEANQSGQQLAAETTSNATNQTNLKLDLDGNNDSDDDDYHSHDEQHHSTTTRSQDEQDILKEVRFSSTLPFNPSLSVCNSPFRASSFLC